MPAAESGTSSPQYDPDALFRTIRAQQASGDYDITIGIIDSEVHDEMFSLLNPENNIIIVSTRTPHLQTILSKSARTFYNYVGLEISAQLLSAIYRRRANMMSDPQLCQPPWHIERLNCLYDWYGMSPVNVTKLLRPHISPRSESFFEEVALSPVYVQATALMARASTRNTADVLFRRLAPDPFVSLIFGTVLGYATSSLSSDTKWYGTAAFYLLAISIIAWRATLLLSDRSRIG